jgi:hypothetical protein
MRGTLHKGHAHLHPHLLGCCTAGIGSQLGFMTRLKVDTTGVCDTVLIPVVAHVKRAHLIVRPVAGWQQLCCSLLWHHPWC